jgi:hypothetical protein
VAVWEALAWTMDFRWLCVLGEHRESNLGLKACDFGRDIP